MTVSHAPKIALVFSLAALLYAAAGCGGGDCVDFDPQGRCIEATDTGGDTVASGVVVESGVVSIPLATLTRDSLGILNDDGWCECGFCHTVWLMSSESATLGTAAETAYGAFLAEVATKLGPNPRKIEVTKVSVTVDPASVSVSGYEQVLTDIGVYLIGEDVFELGTFTEVVGDTVSMNVADPGDLQPRWHDAYLSGDYIVRFRGSTPGSQYTSLCSCPPSCPDCECTEFPDTFELKLIVNLEFRAEG